MTAMASCPQPDVCATGAEKGTNEGFCLHTKSRRDGEKDYLVPFEGDDAIKYDLHSLERDSLTMGVLLYPAATRTPPSELGKGCSAQAPAKSHSGNTSYPRFATQQYPEPRSLQHFELPHSQPLTRQIRHPHWQQDVTMSNHEVPHPREQAVLEAIGKPSPPMDQVE